MSIGLIEGRPCRPGALLVLCGDVVALILARSSRVKKLRSRRQRYFCRRFAPMKATAIAARKYRREAGIAAVNAMRRLASRPRAKSHKKRFGEFATETVPDCCGQRNGGELLPAAVQPIQPWLSSTAVKRPAKPPNDRRLGSENGKARLNEPGGK